MSKQMNEVNNSNDEKIKEKKGKRRTITTLGYVLMILFLLIVLPVVLPPIFGYHTHTLGSDSTGLISKGSVVYVKEIDDASYVEGNIVAIEAEGRDVDVYYVDANDADAKTLTVRDGSAVDYDQIVGHVVAKTPFMGYLCQLCFSVLGIIVTIVIFAAALSLMMYANKISKEINQQLEDQKAQNQNA